MRRRKYACFWRTRHFGKCASNTKQVPDVFGLEQSQEKGPELIAEYVELLASLRQEILRYLQDQGNDII